MNLTHRAHPSHVSPIAPRAVAVIVAVILATALPGCLEDGSDWRYYVLYDVEIYSSGPCEVVMPIPVVAKLVNLIEVFDGTGNFSFVDTIHGRCARITTDSHIEVRGMGRPKDEDEWRFMTPNLTTMDLDGVEPYAFEDQTLPDRLIWIELPFPSNASLWLRSSMSHPNGISYSFHYRTRLDGLEVGWNEVLVEGFAKVPISR